MKNFTIIIPNYNKNEVLEETYKELLLQIHTDDEILIVDDHSPKGAPDYDCQCTRTIQPPKHTPHIWRLNTLRNYGLEHAKYDWCIILDPDCMPNPHFIDNARNMIDPSVLFTGRIDKVQEDGSILVDTRNNSDVGYWADYNDKSGAPVWGGCMAFSKSRTKLVGWFDEDYNGGWGCGETDFAAKCYHSGMRIRYSVNLQVEHQYHEKDRHNYQRNRTMWIDKVDKYRNALNRFTPYQPAVGVMVITMLRPELINQCLQSIFRNPIPLKVRLINNGDTDEDTRRICKEWGKRWAVDYVYHETKWPAAVRNDTMRWANQYKYKYLMAVDDDMIVLPNALGNLVKTIEAYPQYYAVSGYQINSTSKSKAPIGGNIEYVVNPKNRQEEIIFWTHPLRQGLNEADWVGAGCTVHKTKPTVFYDENYKTGFNDYDWCMQLRKQGLKVATTGDAGAYHKYMVTPRGIERYIVPEKYRKLRYDNVRHEKNNDYFQEKWGKRILVRSEAKRRLKRDNSGSNIRD